MKYKIGDKLKFIKTWDWASVYYKSYLNKIATITSFPDLNDSDGIIEVDIGADRFWRFSKQSLDEYFIKIKNTQMQFSFMDE